MKGLLAILLASGLGTPLAFARGTSEAFLKIGVGARPIGMGNAFTAVSDDISAIAWNPGGLSRLSKKEVGLMHAELFADTRYDFVGYAHPMVRPGGLDYGTLGLGVQYLTYGAVESRGADRRQTGSFSGSDVALNVTYSRPLVPSVQLGANIKYLRNSIENESAQSFALDLGTMYRPSWGGLVLGAAIQNLGPGVKFINETDPLPLTLAVGSAYRMRSGLLLALDVKNRPKDSRISISFGTEYAVFSRFALRAGYLSATGSDISASKSAATNKFESLSGLGAGLGLKLGAYNLDYSFSPYGELGNMQWVSVGARF